MRSMRLLLLAVVALALLAAAPTAAAQTDPDSHSNNLKRLAVLPKTGTVNSDLAFWGRTMIAGNYDGFRVVDISDPEAPTVLSDFSCPGPQGDVSVWKSLLFVSVDQVRTKPTCDSAPAPSSDLTNPSNWEGIRIFDISNPASPQYVTAVATDCGSHTHTLVSDLAHGRVLLYVLSYALRSGPHCGPEAYAAGQADSPLHEEISIVAVPLNNPAGAYVISKPKITGQVFDLGIPGFNPTIGCHDVSVFLELHLAAAACLSEGQYWDITDPVHPKTLEAIHVDNPDIEIWHSSAFTWDGKVVIWGDESETGSCNTTDEADGRVWFYRLTSPTTPAGSFLIPRTQAGDYCSAHLFNVVPVKGRYLLTSSWYGGGVDVVDFTDLASAKELGYYDAAGGSVWSAYWYNGFIYDNDIPRGQDFYLFSDPARAGAKRFPYMNPQTQEALLR
jgi:LVIVD repeat